MTLDEVDWHAVWRQEAAKFQAETRTTSFLIGLLREAQTPCQRCGGLTGSAVLVIGDTRSFVCDICVARTPAFTERLATRMRDDKHLLDRIAEAPDQVAWAIDDNSDAAVRATRVLLHHAVRCQVGRICPTCRAIKEATSGD